MPPPSPAPAILAPEPDQGPPRWRALAIEDSFLGPGYALGCALDQGGSLWCWGEDAALQTGLRPDRAQGIDDPLRARRYAPLSRVSGLEAGVELATSLDQTCVITETGDLRCLDLRSPEWWTPTPGVDVRAVELSGERGCALSRAGQALCWSKRGPAEHRADGVLDLSLDRERGCLAHANGHVGCWTDAGPTQGLAPLAGVRELALRGTRLVGLDGEGRVHVHSLDEAAPPRGWVASGRVDEGVELGLGTTHLCVRSAHGSLACRGKGSFGQRGDGSSSVSERFVSVELAPIHALAASDNRTCALTHDAIVCTGLDRSLEHRWHQHTLPELRAQSLAAHRHTTCAHDTDGALRCWGASLLSPSGASGLGMSVERGALPQVRAEAIDELRGLWTDLGTMAWAGGDGQLHHAMWIDSQAEWIEAFVRDLVAPAGPILTLEADAVACAIEAAAGGKRALACARLPADRQPVAGVGQVRELTIGDRRVCTLDDKGLVACGLHPDLGEDGALGLAPIAGLSGIEQLAATRTHVCALDQLGRVHCWADDGPRDLGLTGVTAMVGYDHGFCSLDEAGAPACWAPGAGGELEPRPTPSLSSAQVELVAGSEHVCSRDTEGRVSCWGFEDHGQLGRIPAALSLVFQPIEQPEP